MDLNLLLILVAAAFVLAVAYAAVNYLLVRRLKEGSRRMQEIAAAIREGANAFLRYEYRSVAVIGCALALLLSLFIAWQTGVAFLLGAFLSGAAGFVGMKIATYANVRVAHTADETRSLCKTLSVAFRGGSVMGLCVAGFALFGILVVYACFGIAGGMLTLTAAGDIAVQVNPVTGQSYNFSVVLSGYALGCSVIAIFSRVGGGIYTKAADMGADLVGKTEAHIPEDDPRNPATIADNVGDNVGDVAGLGADLLESYVGAILATVILAIEIFVHTNAFTSPSLLQKMMLFPIVFAGIGLLGCIVGISYPLLNKKETKDPHLRLNLSTWIAAVVAVAGVDLLFDAVPALHHVRQEHLAVAVCVSSVRVDIYALSPDCGRLQALLDERRRDAGDGRELGYRRLPPVSLLETHRCYAELDYLLLLVRRRRLDADVAVLAVQVIVELTVDVERSVRRERAVRRRVVLSRAEQKTDVRRRYQLRDSDHLRSLVSTHHATDAVHGEREVVVHHLLEGDVASAHATLEGSGLVAVEVALSDEQAVALVRPRRLLEVVLEYLVDVLRDGTCRLPVRGLVVECGDRRLVVLLD